MYAIGVTILFIGALLFPIFMIVGLISIFNSDLRNYLGLFALGFFLSTGLFLTGAAISNSSIHDEDSIIADDEDKLIKPLKTTDVERVSDNKTDISSTNEDEEKLLYEKTISTEDIEMHEEVLAIDNDLEEQSPLDKGSLKTGSGENFNKYHNEDNHITEDRFVLNTSTMKIHKPECKDVEKIKDDNYETSSESLEELKAQGYSECGHCFK